MEESVKEQTRHNDILEPGKVLANRFEIVEHLAEGGMGRVYIALQRPIGRKVALKVMRRELINDNSSVKRFFREAVAVSKLTHPNTITIIDYGESEDKQLFIAMEFLDGDSLDKLLHKGELSLERVISIVGQIARSLTEAHRKGVVHRDLKPENIFISPVEGNQDFVKVLDFGIARLQLPEGEEGAGATRITREGYVCGTPEYMSPEQARGEEFDGRTDLYALGVMFWEMAEGNVPFDAPTPLGIVLKHQSDPIPEITADIPEPLKQFIYRAMSKDMNARPSSAEAFLDELMAACPEDMSNSNPLVSARRRSVTPNTPPGVRQTDNALAMAPTQAFEASSDDADPIADVPDLFVPETRKSSKMIPVVVASIILLFVSVGALIWALASDQNKTTTEASSAAATTAVVVPTPVKKTRLMVAGVPADAYIYQNGALLGNAPRSFEGKSGDTVTLVVKKEGFEDATLTGIYPNTDEEALRYELKPIVLTLSVNVVSEPAGATVFRGDKELGKTPFDLKYKADEAPFELRLAHADHKEGRLSVTADSAGKSLNTTLDAKESEPGTTTARVRPNRRTEKPKAKPKTKPETAVTKPKTPPAKPKETPKTEPKPKTKPKYKLVP